jgi:dephospho-CoA kinase
MRIGIAGYMGSGKSTAAHALAGDTGCLIDADILAKALIASDPQIKNQLSACFGGSVIQKGNVRFDHLSRQVFHSLETLRALNAIVHPMLIIALKEALEGCSQEVRILDAAPIPLWKIEPWFDQLIWIDTPFEARFERLALRRPDLSPEELTRRMRLQEELFPPPVGPLWTTVGNEKYINTLSERLFALKHPPYPPRD